MKRVMKGKGCGVDLPLGENGEGRKGEVVDVVGVETGLGGI